MSNELVAPLWCVDEADGGQMALQMRRAKGQSKLSISARLEGGCSGARWSRRCVPHLGGVVKRSAGDGELQQ